MASVVQFTDVSVNRGGSPILDSITWSVEENERWVILGPNGAGKTTLLQLASSFIHPSRGQVDLLGSRLGGIDVFELRPRIGFASTAMARRFLEEHVPADVLADAAAHTVEDAPVGPPVVTQPAEPGGDSPLDVLP